MLRGTDERLLGALAARAKAIARPGPPFVDPGLAARAPFAQPVVAMPRCPFWLAAWAAAALPATAVAATPRGAPPAAAPPIAPAIIDDTLDIFGEAVAAQEDRSRLSVPVWINDQGPFRFLVDSGADRSVVGARMASQLGLPSGPGVRLHDVAGDRDAATVRLGSLRVGGSRVADLVVPVLNERHMGAQGIIGIDALAEHRLMLDFERREVTVQASSRRAPDAASDEIVVVARRRRGQLIITQASAGSTQIQAVIDTGAEVTLGNARLKARVLGGRTPLPLRPVALMGVSGDVVMADMVVVPRMRIGSLTVANVPVAFAEIPPFKLFGLTETPAVLLGTDVLEAFRRVSLDFAAKRVRFQLR